MTDEINNDDKPANVIEFSAHNPSPKKTIIESSRRYPIAECKHKGPYSVDEKKWSVECGDCGALLNPIWVMIQLARQEAYYSRRIEDLSKHLKEINEEIKDRARTKCTHCGNMTAIRFKHRSPMTWNDY